MAHGDVCHIELHSSDSRATSRFYESVFGWTFQDIPGFETYAMFRTPAGLGGGIDSDPNAEAPSKVGPILHIETEDIGASLKKIEDAGGETLVGKTKISDEFGHYALFLDNVGNRLGLWSA